MKYLIFILLLVSVSVKGEEKESPPSKLKDGTITIKLKDGTTTTVNENDFKVVPRVKHPKAKPMPAPSPCPKQTVVKEVVKEEAPKNKLSLYGGYAPNGYNSSTSGRTTTIDKSYGPVMGAGYSKYLFKVFDKPVDGQAIIFSNKSYFGGFGVGF